MTVFWVVVVAGLAGFVAGVWATVVVLRAALARPPLGIAPDPTLSRIRRVALPRPPRP